MSLKMQLRKIYDHPSKWGERLGWEWLIYNPGVYVEFGLCARRNAPLFGTVLLDAFSEVSSIIDVGCGTGHFSAYLSRRGKRVVGFEYSRLARLWARRLRVDVRPFDLAAPMASGESARADLAISLEVGEHIPPALSQRFVDFLCATAPVVVLTCAPPGQPGNGHINCQPKQYWRDSFSSNGYAAWVEKEFEMTSALATYPQLSPFLRDNLMVFRQVRSAKSQGTDGHC